MAKVKSIIMEGNVGYMEDVVIEYVSLVGHAANRQPFKIIKGEVKGDSTMPKQVIYDVLIPKDVKEERLQEIMTEHDFSTEQKSEDALEGYTVYRQVDDKEVDPESRKMAELKDGVYVVIADLKEESELPCVEKEMEYQTLDKLAEAMYAMESIVIGTLRQPEADGMNRKAMVMEAVSNFGRYADAVLSTVKREEVLVGFESETEDNKEDAAMDEKETFLKEYEAKIKEELISEFNRILEERISVVKAEFAETKTTLNTSLNEQFELYIKKEDAEKEIVAVKAEIDGIRTTTKTRNSERDEEMAPTKKQVTAKRQNQFITFV